MPISNGDTKMRIPLDRQSEIPLYQQIGTYLRQAILSGNLTADTRLPACRQLAHDLGVNRTTSKMPMPNWKQMGWSSRAWAAARMSCRKIRIPAIPKNNRCRILPLWQQSLQSNHIISKSDVVDEMLAAAGHPHPISFASGVSDARQFPSGGVSQDHSNRHAPRPDRRAGIWRAQRIRSAA